MFAKLNYVEHVIKAQTQDEDVNIYEDVGRRSHNFGSRKENEIEKNKILSWLIEAQPSLKQIAMEQFSIVACHSIRTLRRRATDCAI